MSAIMMMVRQLSVLDAESGQVALTVDCAHERPVHCVSIPQPSVHVPLSSDCYSFFATAAMDNAVCLWDIRSAGSGPTARYTNHVNRRERVSAAVSPCLRYVAVASEDKTVRLVDVRGGFRELARLSGAHRDVVSGVAFNPLFAQLASCSFDGSVQFYVGPAVETS